MFEEYKEVKANNEQAIQNLRCALGRVKHEELEGKGTLEARVTEVDYSAAHVVEVDGYYIKRPIVTHDESLIDITTAKYLAAAINEHMVTIAERAMDLAAEDTEVHRRAAIKAAEEFLKEEGGKR